MLRGGVVWCGGYGVVLSCGGSVIVCVLCRCNMVPLW